VFAHTAHYDAMIANYLKQDEYPDTLTLTFEKIQDLRYGENPHQSAAFYRDISKFTGELTDMEQLHGIEISFNNINDTNGALGLLREFDEPTVVVCKHGCPCGVGSGDTIKEAYMKAYLADPVSIFGGIIVANSTIDGEAAAEMAKISLLDIILAPSFTDEAFTILSKRKNVRLIKLNRIDDYNKSTYDIKKVSGGLIIQSFDSKLIDDYTVVTKRTPTEKELSDLMFAWKLVKYAKSNGIAIGKDKQSLGIGTGQVCRIWACKQAIEHCEEHLGKEILKGSVLASDAFFPFSDCVEEAAKAGITAIIQPGGSLKDKDSIEVCDKHGIAMIFTGMRHFKH
jgi:phosphoribosylaminoimidazolecarboxamide formyltransferase/IMP cyclohydrolase